MVTPENLRAVRLLLEAFVDGSDRSIQAAQAIEVALDPFSDADEIVWDYASMFAQYRPEGGDYLYSTEEVVEVSLALLKRLAAL